MTEGAGVVGAAAMAAAAGTLALTWQTTDEPAEVHVTGMGAFEPMRVSAVTADAPASPDGPHRTAVVGSARRHARGRTPDLPRRPRGRDRVPLVLNVHGGPSGVFTQSFTGSPSIYMIQYFAQEGFAVLRPNPRGSSGYGKEFRYANFMDWASATSRT